MYAGRIIGNVLSTIKNEKLNGYKLFVVESNIGSNLNQRIIAVDLAGAGIGDSVMILSGSQVNNAIGANVPIDAAVIGIIDKVSIDL